MYPRFLQLLLNNQIENLKAVFNDEYDTPSYTKKVFANMRRQGKDFSRRVTPLFETMLIQHLAEVADETIHEDRGDIVERAATTTSSLEVEQDSGNILRTQSMATLNELIPYGTGSGSGPRHQHTILGDRPAETRFKRLSKQSNEPPFSRDTEVNTASIPITTASINITTAEPISTVSAPITTSGVYVSTAKPSTPPKATTLIKYEDLTIAHTLMKIRSVKSKENSKEKRVSSTTLIRGVIMNEASETTTRPTVPPQQQLDPKDKEVVEGSSHAEGSKKRPRKELDEASVNRQQLEDDVENAKLKLCLEIVPKDDEAINIESLAIKYPIVDWKTHILDKNKMYYQIIKADESSKYYKIFSKMLDNFDRQDVLDLYIVKERFETTNLEGYDRLLWGDLITLFEPSREDEIRKAQQDYTLISWRKEISSYIGNSLNNVEYEARS
nr:hypothetical protein [Tanacetum cinerariifolium]